MQTFKTAVVVALLLVVLYGAYQVVNRPVPETPSEVAELMQDEMFIEPPTVDFDQGVATNQPSPPTIAGPYPPTSDSPFPGQPAAGYPPTDAESFPGPGSSGPGSSGTGPRYAPAGPPVADQASVPGSSTPGSATPNSAAPGTVAPDTLTPGSATPHNSTPTGTGYPVTGSGTVGNQSPTYSNPGYQAPADPRLQNNPFLHERMADSDTNSAETPAGSAGAGPRTAGERGFVRAWQAAERDLEKGNYRDALIRLSIFYRSPDLTAQEHEELLDLLDPLAGKVVYSPEHLLESPYKVRRNETLMEVADQYQVPWQLLQKINQVKNPQVLVSGQELKVVPGPFRAQVDLSRGEMTLFLGDMYAGRFPISVGSEPMPQPGTYTVRDKQLDRTFYGNDGRTIPGGHPHNPYGRVWVDLGSEVCIHGSQAEGLSGNRGCIGLSPRDAEDVFAILSLGSEVRIQ